MRLTKYIALLLIALSLASCGIAGLAVDGSDEALSRGLPAIQLIGARTRMFSGPAQTYEARLSGDIELENIAYAKVVRVAYSVNGGTWKEAAARYVKSLGGNREHWAFEIGLGLYENVGDPRAGFTGARVVTQFALKYQVAGRTYWDNNGGAGVDYRLSTEGSGLPPYPPAAFGKNAAVLTYASYTDYPNTYFRGTVAVRKTGTDRSLRVVFSTDGWKTVQTADYAYVMESHDGWEKWFFTDFQSDLDPMASVTFEFAVEYVVDGVSFWDNNVFDNYRVGSYGVNAPRYF